MEAPEEQPARVIAICKQCGNWLTCHPLSSAVQYRRWYAMPVRERCKYLTEHIVYGQTGEGMMTVGQVRAELTLTS